jgi:hypothetical protein
MVVSREEMVVSREEMVVSREELVVSREDVEVGEEKQRWAETRGGEGGSVCEVGRSAGGKRRSGVSRKKPRRVREKCK